VDVKPAEAVSSHSLVDHHKSPDQSPHVVMPAHHINEYFLIKKETRQTEMHPQG
jgi:hypothetical protein